MHFLCDHKLHVGPCGITFWSLGSNKRPRKCDHWTRDVSEDEEDEEDENEVPHDLHCTISHLNGEAGQGGDSGRGFNIQKLIGLSEDKA